MITDKYKFYLILCVELMLWPFLWLAQQVKMAYGTTGARFKERQVVENYSITVGVHEWGGYGMERKKKIKNGATFDCGLKYQLERFTNNPNVELVVTISDAHKHNQLEYVKSKATVIEVCNKGMDFSGYAAIFDAIKKRPNQYIILTNSSVNAMQSDFLDGYIAYMEQNPDVGLLGVSYCTKIIQTLVRHNFTPHLQSFFLLTTTDVFREVVSLNKGKFPGKGIDHKLLLIRKGEIRLSQLVQKAGYRLAIVNPLDGKPYKFECFRGWKLPFGDIRQKINTPNRITPIKI